MTTDAQPTPDPGNQSSPAGATDPATEPAPTTDTPAPDAAPAEEPAPDAAPADTPPAPGEERIEVEEEITIEEPAPDAPNEALGRPSNLVDETNPAGAVWPGDNTGTARQHGENDDQLGVTPAEDATPAEPAAPPEGVQEPDQVETDRPDIGTE